MDFNLLSDLIDDDIEFDFEDEMLSEGVIPKAFRASGGDVRLNEPLREEIISASVTFDYESVSALPNVKKELEEWWKFRPWEKPNCFLSDDLFRCLGHIMNFREEAHHYPFEAGAENRWKEIREVTRRQTRALLGEAHVKNAPLNESRKPGWYERKFAYLAGILEGLVQKLSASTSARGPLTKCEIEGGSGFSFNELEDGTIWAPLTESVNIFSSSSTNWLHWKINDHQVATIHLYGGALRAWADVFRGRASVITACRLASEIKADQYPSLETVLEVWDWGDQLLMIKGNEAYRSIKNFESCLIGRLLQLSKEKIVDQNAFYSLMMSEIEATAGPDSQQQLHKILARLSDNQHVSQIFGLFRTWSHPATNTKAGILKMKEASFKNLPLNISTCKLVTAKAIEIYCENYFSTHGCYPNISFPGVTITGQSWQSSEVYSAVRCQRRVDKLHKNYNLDDWRRVAVRFRESKGDNLNELSLMSDKSASLTRSRLQEQFDAGKPIPGDDDRRVLLSYIKKPYEPLGDILRRIDREGLTDDQLTIGVVPKERELKIEPRMFSLTPYDFRMYIVSTEALLAHYALPYYPHITMTQAGGILKRKMIQSTSTNRTGSRRDAETLLFNFDFIKWNSMQRGLLVHPTFAFHDHINGYRNLLSKTHDFFSRTVHYRADNIIRPTGEEYRNGTGDSAWVGQLGGNEGLRQKGWTIVTVAAIALALNQEGIRFNLYGQGDNQVLLLEIPRRYKETGEIADLHYEEARLKASRAMDRVTSVFSDIGLPMKKEETWQSSKVFAYSKILFSDGLELAQSNKRITRQYFLLNADYPTTTSQIGSVFAAATATMEYDHSPFIAFEMAIHETSRAILWGRRYSQASPYGLLRHPITGAQITHLNLRDQVRIPPIHVDSLSCAGLWNDVDVVVLSELISLLPAALGGFASQSLVSSLTKGLADQVSIGAMICKRYIKENKLYAPLLCSYVCEMFRIPLKVLVDPAQLMEDPSSVNILRNQQSKNIMKEGVIKYLQQSSTIKNGLVKAIVSLDKEEYKEKADVLWETTPFMPRLCSLLMNCDPSGQGKTWVSQYDKTATIQRAARRDAASEGIRIESSENLEQRLALSDSASFIYFLWRLSDKTQSNIEFWPPPHEGTNLFKWAQGLREASWHRKDIAGVTISHPLAYAECFPAPEGECAVCKTYNLEERPAHIHVRLHPAIVENPKLMYECRGPTLPYLGGKTLQKTTIVTEYSFEHEGTALKLALRILATLGWIVDPKDNLAKELMRRASALTDVKYHEMVSGLIECSSSVLHRLDDPRTSHSGSPSLSTGPYTWLMLSTNTMKEFSKGSTNRALHFQQLLTHAQAIVGLFVWCNIHNGRSPASSYHLHILDSDEIPVVEEKLVRFIPDSLYSRYLPNHEYQRHPEIPFLFTPREKAKPHIRIHAASQNRLYKLEDLNMKEQRLIKDVIISQKAMRMAMVAGDYASKHREAATHLEYIWVEFCNPISVLEDIAKLALVLLFWHHYPSYLKAGMALRPEQRLRFFLTYGLALIDTLPNELFHSASSLFLNRSCRNRLHSYTFIPTARGVDLGQEEANSWAKRAVIAMLIRWRSDPALIKRGVLFSLETIGVPVSPREVVYNFFWSIVLSKSLLPLGGFRQVTASLATVLTDYMEGKIHAGDLEEALIGFPFFSPDIRKLAIESATVRRLQDTEDNLESKLRGYITQPPSRSMTNNIRRSSGACVGGAHFFFTEGMKLELISVDLSLLAVSPIGPKTCGCSHLLRPFDTVTSAHFKLRDVLSWIPNLGQIDLAAVLADGTGGFGAVIAEIYHPEKIWYTTLTTATDGIPGSHTEIGPPLLERMGYGKESLLGEDLVVDGGGDITSPTYFTRMENRLKGQKVSLLTIDAEWNTTNLDMPVKMGEVVKKLRIVLKQDGLAIVKTYLSNDFISRYFLSICISEFESVMVYSSGFSSHRSTEVYVAMQKLRAEALSSEVRDGCYIGPIPSMWISPLIRLSGEKLRPEPGLADVYRADDFTREFATEDHYQDALTDWYSATRFVIRRSIDLSIDPNLVFTELQFSLDKMYRFEYLRPTEGRKGSQLLASHSRMVDIGLLLLSLTLCANSSSFHPIKELHNLPAWCKLIVVEIPDGVIAAIIVGDVPCVVAHNLQQHLLNLKKKGKEYPGIQVFGLPDYPMSTTKGRKWLRKIASLRLLNTSPPVSQKETIYNLISPLLKDPNYDADKRTGLNLILQFGLPFMTTA